MEKYILIIAIIIYVTQKAYLYVWMESLDISDYLKIRYWKFQVWMDIKIANISRFISYILFIISGIMFIIKYL